MNARRAAVPLLLSFLLAAVGRPAHAQNLPPEKWAEDSRLDQRVTVIAPRICVGDVLERFSKATGVELEADSKDGAANEQVCVWLHDVRLADALDALWSLLSYENALWRWDRERQGEHWRYVLSRPLSAQRLAQSLRDKAQRDFEEQAAALMAGIDADEATRKQLAERVPSAGPLLAGSGRLRSGLLLLRGALSPSALASALGGGDPVRVATSDLAPDDRQFVHDEWVLARPQIKGADGSWTDAPEPAWVSIGAPLTGEKTTRSLYIQLQNMGGYAYIGGTPLEKAFGTELLDRWMLPGDARRAEGDTAPLKPKPQPELAARSELERYLAELSAGMKLSILARLGTNGPPFAAPVEGSPLSDWLEFKSKDVPLIQNKWRGKVLLVAPGCWINDPILRDPPPWPVIRHLRKAQARSGGMIDFEALCCGATQLTPVQMGTIAPEFEAFGHTQWHALLSRLGRADIVRRQILTEEGAPIAHLLEPIEPIIPVAEAYANRAVASVRIRYTTTVDEGVPTRTVELETLDKDRKVVGQSGFYWNPPGTPQAVGLGDRVGAASLSIDIPRRGR